jgi:hypothetical protein
MPFDVKKIKTGAAPTAPRIVLIGVPGVGKTTAGSLCPSPIFLSAEDGLVGQGYDNVPHYTAEDWGGVLSFLDFIGREQHDYKSLVVDTVDWLEPILFAYVYKRDGKKDIEDYGYGKGYTAAADEFRRALAKLDIIHQRGILVLINAHCHIKAFSNPTGDNYDRYELKCNSRIAGMVTEWVDAVLFARYEVYTAKAKGDSKAKGVGGETRVVQTQYSAAWSAKNRYGLPATMPFDMPTILEAMTGGKAESPENIIAKINELLPSLPEDIRGKITDYLATVKTDVAGLTKTLNRVKTLAQEAGE